MKTLKIYGVTGLLEWNAIIPCNNGVKLHVNFEGGSLSSWGSIPAKYRTDDEVVQALIEGSSYFKKGKITLLRTIQVAQPTVAPASVQKPKATPKPAQATKPVEAMPTVEEQPAEATKAVETMPTEGEEVAEENSVTGLKQVKVADVEGEGKKYLMDNYGVKAGQLRGVNAVLAQAKAHGIEFVTE